MRWRGAAPRPRANREAERLREFIQRNVHSPDVPVPEQDAQREAQLLERARREGLIDPAALTRRTRRLMRPAAIRALVALAAGVGGIAVALTVSCTAPRGRSICAAPASR